MDKVVFLLTHSEAEFWVNTYPAVDFNKLYDPYHFIVLDNGNQPLMEEWCKLTNSTYYSAEYNIGSSGGYNWIFRVAHLIKCKRAVLLQTDVEILNRETLDKLFESHWQDHEIPFWPQVPRHDWDINDPGQVYNLGQFFSFNPYYILYNNLLIDENYVVTHYDDADVARRMREIGTKLYNCLLEYPDLDCIQSDEGTPSHVVEGLYKIHHLSSSSTDNHKSWEDYNYDYHRKKWFKDDSHAYSTAFGQTYPANNIDESTKQQLYTTDINKSEPHSFRWMNLDYPPYPVEYEVNRFWNTHKYTYQ